MGVVHTVGALIPTCVICKTTDYGRPVRKSPSLHGRKSNCEDQKRKKNFDCQILDCNPLWNLMCICSIIKEKVKEILRVEGSWLCPRRLRFFYMQSSKKSMIHVLHAYGRHLSLDNQSCTKRPLLIIFLTQFWKKKL